MAKVSEIKIEKLTPDSLNANKGTEYGQHLMEKSFRELGAGRSILLDRNGKIIAGNKSAETAVSIGMQDVIVVESDGTKLVAVKRMDIDIDSKQGRELALADNATSKANLEWDQKAIEQISEKWAIAPEDWGIVIPAIAEEEAEEEKTYIPTYKFEVQCKSEGDKNLLFAELLGRGFTCTDDY